MAGTRASDCRVLYIVRRFFHWGCPLSPAEIIRSNPWFKSLSEVSVEQLASAAHVRRIKDNKLWVSRSEIAPGLAIILQGGLRMVVVAENGRAHTVSILRKGAVWGAISLVDGKPNVHDVHAYGATRLLLIERKTMRRALAKPDVSMAIMQIFAYRLHKAYAMVDDHVLRPLETRLARFLLTLKPADEEEHSRRHPSFVRITQDEVANAIGCTRPTANQKLKRLEDDGLIERAYGGLNIVNRRALRSLCEGDEIFDV